MLAAAVQFAPAPDASATRLLLDELLGSDELAAARLIVLPEASQCALGGRDEPLVREPEALDGPFVALLHAHARARSATIVAGLFEDPGDGGLPYNTTVVIDEGGLRHAYRKIHLFDALGATESAAVRPGPVDDSNLVTFELEDFTVGIQTCYDLRFGELSRALVDAGADLLVLGAAWYSGPEKVAQWLALSSARAIESTAYLVAAAQPAPMFSGTSRIVDPRGVALAEAPQAGGAIVQAELHASLVGSVRSDLPVVSSRRLGAFGEC
jgi:predicted amidohydrolase